MKVINYVEVPATQQEDINQGKTTWRDGKYVMLDEGRHVTLYIGHREETRHEVSPEGETTERQVTLAFPVRVEKPLTKDKAVNAALSAMNAGKAKYPVTVEIQGNTKGQN